MTAEEATTAGGLGGAVAETVVQHHPTRMTHPRRARVRADRLGRRTCSTATACRPRASPTPRAACWRPERASTTHSAAFTLTSRPLQRREVRVSAAEWEERMGVNLVEGGIAGKAVDVGAITSPTGAPGLTVSYNMQLISTVENLYDSIGVSVAAGGRYGLFSAQGKVQYAKEVKFNSQSTFLLARCFVEKAFQQCEDAGGLRTSRADAGHRRVVGDGDLWPARWRVTVDPVTPRRQQVRGHRGRARECEGHRRPHRAESATRLDFDQPRRHHNGPIRVGTRSSRSPRPT